MRVKNTIEQKEYGMLPVNVLLSTLNVTRFERLEIVEGMLPVKRLAENSRRRSSVRVENELGMVPVN
jgi:hypothetical protein